MRRAAVALAVALTGLTTLTTLSACTTGSAKRPPVLSTRAVTGVRSTPAPSITAGPSERTPAPDPRHPGAAVLAGTVRRVPAAAVEPTPARAPDDGAYTGRCQAVQPSVITKTCTLGDTRNYTTTVALVGDSTASQWFAAIDSIALERHWRIVTYLHSVCPWGSTVVRWPSHGGPYTPCHTWGAKVLSAVLQLHPSVVITAARATVGTLDDPGAGATAHREIAAGIEKYWSVLQRHGIAVAAMRESPEMGFDVPQCLAAHHGSVSACSVSESSAVLTDSPMQLATRALPHEATLIDMTRYICLPTRCRPVVGNVLVYQDEHHLTNTYVGTTTPYLRAKLLAVPALAH